MQVVLIKFIIVNYIKFDSMIKVNTGFKNNMQKICYVLKSVNEFVNFF